MERKRNQGTRLRALAVCLIVGCFAFGAVLASAATTSGKAKTKVSIKFFEDEPGVFVYETAVKKPRKCKKNRSVIVYHDENGNRKRDKNEFVIGKGKTNRRGHFDFDSPIAPPEGDRIGVEVKKNRKCKAGKASTRA